MFNSHSTPARQYAPGIGTAVADRTVNRMKADGTRETWADVAKRVALGSASLHRPTSEFEFDRMHHHLRQASVLMSGRHLQHGDETQSARNIEVFSNCSTAASSFVLFYLLLNGSGVGRAYDDDMMIVDWAAKMPKVFPIIRHDHADVISGEIAPNFVEPLGLDTAAPSEVFEVPDSREGWAKAIECIECMTHEGDKGDFQLLLDFSQVRPRGAPIGGMQDRPASGPGPLMHAIAQIAKLRGNRMPAWEATMHVDHFLAECVLVGGARRAARMSTKTWLDANVIDFVNIKRKGGLWSSNNSVTVDAEFWDAVKVMNANPERDIAAEFPLQSDRIKHAFAVFNAIASASYHDGTGEPGLINVDKLVQKDQGIEVLFDGRYVESSRFKMDERSLPMTQALARAFAGKPYKMIVNPCGEITIILLGGYCLIADTVPHFAQSDDDAEDAFRTATRALLRTNTMNALYGKEVARTNRIGVGITGLHEYAWARFGFSWKDLVNEQASLPFWQMLSRFSWACVTEAISYSAVLGVNVPHTITTIKPAGTTSKLFGLTEGAHLPSMAEYLRWVQFRDGDPLIAEYEAKGYPVRKLRTYTGTTIVGFPTVPEICKLGMGDKLVTAAQATPEEQYQYLLLLEKYWLQGYTENGTRHNFDNQISYTLKYDPKVVDFEHFCRTLIDGQSQVKCCSVMPQIDGTAYEYQPEEPVTPERFQELLANIIDDELKQEIGIEHMLCAGGACPIDFREEKV